MENLRANVDGSATKRNKTVVVVVATANGLVRTLGGAKTNDRDGAAS